MEKAIRRLGVTSLASTEHLHGDWTLVQEYPLSEEMLSLSHVWNPLTERTLSLPPRARPKPLPTCAISHSADEGVAANIDRMTGKGLRVIGVAQASFRQADLPDRQHDFDFEFIGLMD